MNSRNFSPSLYLDSKKSDTELSWDAELFRVISAIEEENAESGSPVPVLFQLTKTGNDNLPYCEDVMFAGFLKQDKRYMLFLADTRNLALLNRTTQAQEVSLSLTSNSLGKNYHMQGRIYISKDPKISHRHPPPQIVDGSDAREFWEKERLYTWIGMKPKVRGLFMSDIALGYYGAYEDLHIHTANAELASILRRPVKDKGDEDVERHDASLLNFAILCIRVETCTRFNYRKEWPPTKTKLVVKDDNISVSTPERSLDTMLEELESVLKI